MKKTVIITGVGRLKGIGAAMARTLAKKGYNIVFTYWSEYDLQVTKEFSNQHIKDFIEELQGYGVKCKGLELDLAKVESIDRLLEEASGFEIVYGLINNACYSVNDDYTTITEESLDRHYEINLRAAALLSCKFVQSFDFNQGGRIINMISGQSLGPMYNELSYAITKGALETLTYTLAAGVAAKRITVNAINPGPNDTGWMNESLKKDLLGKFPFGRVGEPKDTANLAAFLMSEEAEWITGQTINSEGGFIRG